MIRYIFRRMRQMVPTVFGVILITFILFNVAGGDPAAMALGKRTSPKQLEEFAEQRGLNKPLIFGWRAKTRAYEDADFSRSPGRWTQEDAVRHQSGGYVAVADDTRLKPQPLFELDPEVAYEWLITWRASDPAGARPEFGGRSPDPDRGWQTARIRFDGGAMPVLQSGGGVEVTELKLRRRVVHPFDSQLFNYFLQLARGDLGRSLQFKQPVVKLLKDGIGPSLMLTVPIFVGGLVVSVFLALLCAFFRDTGLDRFFVITSVALMSINYLVWIIFGQYWLGYRQGWFPVWGFESWRYLLLPVLIGIISGLGANLRFYRTIMLDEMYRDYVRTAEAKGVRRSRILFVHVLKNAMIPIVTNVVIAIPFLYTGSLLLESFFGIPGLGYLSINAINSSDVDVIRAVVLIGAVLFVVANLLTDICYAWVDPRVKLR